MHGGAVAAMSISLTGFQNTQNKTYQVLCKVVLRENQSEVAGKMRKPIVSFNNSVAN